MTSWIRRKAPAKTPPAAALARPAEAVTAATPPVTLSARGIGDRSGAPARGSAGRTGTSDRERWVEATSVASKAIRASLPVPSAAMKRWWRCSIAGWGWSVTIASLSSSAASRVITFGETRTSESPTLISPRQTSGSSSPVGRPRSRCGSGSVERRAWRIRYASAGPMVATYSSLLRTTAIPIPIGPSSPVPWRASRSRWWFSRLLAEAIAFSMQTRMPADSS